MKAAFTNWNQRIAPVFDTARELHLVEVESDEIVRETLAPFPEDLPVQKALHLVNLNVSILVCGAITRAMDGLLVGYGIQVIPFVAGDLDEVVQAWLKGALADGQFAMPGCRGCRRYVENRQQPKETLKMNGKGRLGMGQGGAGRGGPGRGRGGGGAPRTAGVGGQCVCVKCGYSEAHERGVPCVQRQCPQCGAVMTKQ